MGGERLRMTTLLLLIVLFGRTFLSVCPYLPVRLSVPNMRLVCGFRTVLYVLRGRFGKKKDKRCWRS